MGNKQGESKKYAATNNHKTSKIQCDIPQRHQLIHLIHPLTKQAPQGFSRAGGFRGIYSGLGPALVGSAPGAALFFLTYDSAKHFLSSKAPDQVRVHT